MSRTALKINTTLTNYARGISQDLTSALAAFIAPPVPVGVSAGQFKSFSDKNAFKTYDTSRAIGGPAQRIRFESGDEYFNCKPQALEATIDDAERDLAGDDELELQQAKITDVVSTAALSHEKKVFDLINASVSAVSGKGEWSNAAKDPVAELDELIEEIATETGRLPNRMVIGLGAWRIFKNHPLVKARLSGVKKEGVSLEDAASFLLNPAMDIRMGVLSADLTKMGKAKDAQNIVGANVYVFYAQDVPTRYDPSFAKTFMTKRNSIDSVVDYRDESCESDVYAVRWSEDIKVVSPLLARKLTLS